jgi:protein ImuB
MGARAIEPLYVCVYVPEFPAQALLRLRPELVKAAVVVVAGDPPLEQVCSRNRVAEKAGVLHGMTRAELDSFDGLTVLRRSDAEERGARAVLLQAAAMYTPRIEIQPGGAAAFTMVLDVTGTERIFGPAEAVVEKLLRSIRKQGFVARMAASANLPAAICIAPSARRTSIVVPRGEEKSYLSRLPLAALRLTEKQAETLTMWGLHTVGELAVLPEVELVVRLGQEGKRLRLLACGEQAHLMVPEEPVFALEEYMGFDAPIELLDSVLFVLGPMLDQLVARAQERSYALASVTVRMGLDGGRTHERTIKPALPVMQREVLLKLLHLDLQAHPPEAGILSLFVHAEPGERSKVQMGLFAPQLPEAMRLDVTLARIAALVGEERVGKAALNDSHRADGFVMQRFVVSDMKKTEERGRGPAVALRRCRPPIELSVQLAMQKEGEQPAAFSLQGKRYVVQEAYGPWRRSGDWWNTEVWSREEWDVRATAKADDTVLCLLTHDLLRKHWRLEAMYD